MRRRAAFVIACGLLFCACAKRKIIPDPDSPHQLAKGAKVRAWCLAHDQKMVECEVEYRAGDWCAPAHILGLDK